MQTHTHFSGFTNEYVKNRAGEHGQWKKTQSLVNKLRVINLLRLRRILNHGKGGMQELDDWKSLFRDPVLRGHKWALKQE